MIAVADDNVGSCTMYIYLPCNANKAGDTRVALDHWTFTDSCYESSVNWIELNRADDDEDNDDTVFTRRCLLVVGWPYAKSSQFLDWIMTVDLRYNRSERHTADIQTRCLAIRFARIACSVASQWTRSTAV